MRVNASQKAPARSPPADVPARLRLSFERALLSRDVVGLHPTACRTSGPATTKGFTFRTTRAATAEGSFAPLTRRPLSDIFGATRRKTTRVFRGHTRSARVTARRIEVAKTTEVNASGRPLSIPPVVSEVCCYLRLVGLLSLGSRPSRPHRAGATAKSVPSSPLLLLDHYRPDHPGRAVGLTEELVSTRHVEGVTVLVTLVVDRVGVARRPRPVRAVRLGLDHDVVLV